MRIRRKPWARPELAACPYYTAHPQERRGRWREWFGNDKPIHLELGCGKGGFIARQAVGDAGHNYIAVDLIDAMLGLARRNVAAAYAEAGRDPMENLRLATLDIMRLFLMFEDGVDRVERIYINFCNPWPKPTEKKKRLTHTRQLATYKRFLADGGQLWFKTDDDGLFRDTLGYLAESGFEVVYLTRDLHASGFEGSVPTEHERMFTAQGIPIKFLIAQYNAPAPPQAEPPAP